MSYIVWSRAKKYLLTQAKNTRHHKFTQVSGDVEVHLNRLVMREMDRLVHMQPSKGKTIRI